MEKMRFFIPVRGDHKTLIAEGEYGSRTTSTFSRYDVKVGD